MQTKVITAHLPQELSKKLDSIASRLERPKGWVIKEAIAAYIASDEERHQQTLEALAQVEAGRVVGHQAIVSWADGLGKKTPKRTRTAK